MAEKLYINIIDKKLSQDYEEVISPLLKILCKSVNHDTEQIDIIIQKISQYII